MNNRIIKFRIWAKHLDYEKYKEFDKANGMPPHPQNIDDKELMSVWQKEWSKYNEERSKHTETCFYHKMVYPSNFTVESDTLGWTTQGYLDTGALAEGKTNVDFEPDYVLMQYTGFKDKDGVEVFEGDILQYTDLNPDVVEFLNGGYILRNPKSKLYGSLRGANCSKVIGNIFENPELLK